jgi:hypothetical protein
VLRRNLVDGPKHRHVIVFVSEVVVSIDVGPDE